MLRIEIVLWSLTSTFTSHTQDTQIKPNNKKRVQKGVLQQHFVIKDMQHCCAQCHRFYCFGYINHMLERLLCEYNENDMIIPYTC